MVLSISAPLPQEIIQKVKYQVDDDHKSGTYQIHQPEFKDNKTDNTVQKQKLDKSRLEHKPSVYSTLVIN